MFRRARCSTARRVTGAVVVALTLAGLGSPTARAATTTIACDGSSDIADVQAAVDAAGAGDTIRLSGTCDFSAALPHGGGVASIAAAAVLVRPGAPVADLVIESAPGEQAAIIGSGTQAAFAVAPGNDGVTIRGLRFVNFGRAIVVLGAAGATIGDSGPGVPAVGGNRIVADGQGDSAILAVANSTPMTVQFGAAGVGAGSPVTLTPASVTDLTVVGNQITYSPAGAADPTGARDVVAVDVRQANGGTVSGVDILRNAVAMFGAELGTFRHNGVRVEGLDAVPASAPPALSDYRITDVVVAGNNLGRLEELDPARLTGVDPDERHAAGRVGVYVTRAADFHLVANRVRARLTATVVGAPGGGVVVSDAGFGEIRSNDVVVNPDSSAPDTSDLGGIALAEGIPALFGGSAADQATYSVDVSDNVVGAAIEQPFVSRRGIVLVAADLATVWGNNVWSTLAPGLLVGADIRGPGNTPLPSSVTRAVACGNQYDGGLDLPEEVEVIGTSHTANAFPGGSGFPGSGECSPTVSVSPAPPVAVTVGGGLDVTGRGWASRAVGVALIDDTGASVSKTATAPPTGDYAIAFSEAELASLTDGSMQVVTISAHGPSIARSSAPARAMKNTVVNPPPAGTMTIDDGDGRTGALEVIGGVPVDWEASTAAPTVIVMSVADADGNTPSGCGPWVKPASGREAIPYDCLVRVADGEYEVRVTWHGSDGEQSSLVTDTSVKDTSLPAVTIDTPAEGALVTNSTFDVTGTVSEGGTVTVRTSSFPYDVLGTATVAAPGPWSASLTLVDAPYSIVAFATDEALNEGPATRIRRFSVDDPTVPGEGGPPNGDTTPPAAPVVSSPAEGSLHAGSFAVFGTAEPLSTIFLFINSGFEGTTPVGSNGVWGINVSEGTGAKAIYSLAVDAAGNVSPPSNTLNLTVDATPPALDIATAQDTVFHPLKPVLIEGTADDDSDVVGVLVEYWRAGQSSGPVLTDVAACSPVCPWREVSWASSPDEPLVPGLYSARVIAFDRVGNTSEALVRFFKAP